MTLLLLFALATANERLDRAIEKLQAGRVAEARAELGVLVEREPGNARAHAYLATAEIQTGDVEQAVARAKRLVEDDPEDSDLRELLARAYMASHNWAFAEKQWRIVIERRTRSEEAHFQLASTLAQLGRFEDAQVYAGRAAEINPRRADARALRGNLLASLGRADEAAKEWHGALAADANNHAALAGLAVHLRDKEPEMALEYARRAVELTGWKAVGPIRILASVHRSRGERERAREVLRKGLEKNPDDPALQADLR